MRDTKQVSHFLLKATYLSKNISGSGVLA